jgi:hypothetical protein
MLTYLKRQAVLALLMSGLLFSGTAQAQTSACDLNQDGTVNSTDANLAVDMTLGKQPCTASINGAGICNAVTVQRVVNAGLGQQCLVDTTLPEGLVAAYAFSEGSGATTADVSGNGRTGTISNATWTSSGRYGSALNFDGTTSYVDIGKFDIPGTALTISAWFKADSYASIYPRIVSKAKDFDESSHYFMLATEKTRLRSRVKTGGTTRTLLATSGDLPTGQWVHATVTYDGSAMRLYKDGVEVGSMAVSGSVSTDSNIPVWIGRNPDGTNTFHGVIDELRIYSRALTASEIQNDMNSPLTGVALAPLPSPSAVSLAWMASVSDNVAGYNVYRAMASGGPYSKLNTALIGTTSYLDSTVQSGNTYYYVATAVDTTGRESSHSNQASAIMP